MITAVLAVIGAAVLAATGVVTFFGGYWYRYLSGCVQGYDEPDE
jgi:hypothetical protein